LFYEWGKDVEIAKDTLISEEINKDKAIDNTIENKSIEEKSLFSNNKIEENPILKFSEEDIKVPVNKTRNLPESELAATTILEPDISSIKGVENNLNSTIEVEAVVIDNSISEIESITNIEGANSSTESSAKEIINAIKDEEIVFENESNVELLNKERDKIDDGRDLIVEVIDKELSNETNSEKILHQDEQLSKLSLTNTDSVNERETTVAIADNEIIIEEVDELPKNINEHLIINDNDSGFADTTGIIDSIAPVTSVVIAEKTLSKITTALFFIPNYSYRGFQAASSTSEFYKTNDKAKLRFSFGANVGYSILDKLTVHIGVSYHKLKNEIEVNDARPKELPIIMDPNNNSITINSSLGTVVATNLGRFKFEGDDEDDIYLDDEDDFASLNYKEEQEFVLLDIPLTMRYEMGKGKLKLLIEAGLIASIVMKDQSKIEISNVYSPDEIVSVKNFHQTKKMTLSGTIGVGVKYNLTKRFSLLIIPSYNNSFMDINKDNASTIKPKSLNFSTGLQFQF